MPTVLSRRALYDLVWSKPLRKVAADFGLSDVGLAKICARHRIPTPSRGYWAKVQAGQKVAPAHFREVVDVEIDRIEISSAMLSLPAGAREVIARANAERARKRAAPSRQPVQTVAQPPATQDLHESINPTAVALRKAKPSDGAAVAMGSGHCGINVAIASVERAIHILNDMARQLEARGLKLEPTGQAMRVAVRTDSVQFTLSERTRQEKHVPTDAELAAEDRLRKKRERYWKSPRGWDEPAPNFYERAYPEFDTVYTGALALAVEGYDRGVRRTWADGKTQTVESLLDGFVVGLQTILALRKAEREERDERERQHRELARRRDLAEKRAAREDKRVAYLTSILDLHDEIERLRRWVDLARGMPDGGASSSLARMIAWTTRRLETLEIAVAPESIEEHLHEEALFPIVDDLYDPEGEPPEDSYRWW